MLSEFVEPGRLEISLFHSCFGPAPPWHVHVVSCPYCELNCRLCACGISSMLLLKHHTSTRLPVHLHLVLNLRVEVWHLT
jgi:hypothetical protein